MKKRIKAVMLLSVFAGALNASPAPVRIFHPYGSYIHKLTTEISDAKPTMERIEFSARENENSNKMFTRKGVLVKYPNAQANIVISHGFMCDKFDVGFLRSLFPKGRYNFLTFDFRAHGENRDGQVCTFGRDEAYDVQAATQFLKNHKEIGHLPILGYGFSMGAVASIEAQSKDPNLFAAMILDCPFDSTENVVKKALNNMQFSLFGYKMNVPGRTYLEKYAFHPYVQSFVKLLLKSVAHMDARNIQAYMHRFTPAESVKNISCPCFFIHCKRDQRVPVESIKNIFNGAQGPKKLWLTNGRSHYDSVFYNPEKYAHKINKFIDNVMSGRVIHESRKLVVEDEDDVPPQVLEDTHERA